MTEYVFDSSMCLAAVDVGEGAAWVCNQPAGHETVHEGPVVYAGDPNTWLEGAQPRWSRVNASALADGLVAWLAEKGVGAAIVGHRPEDSQDDVVALYEANGYVLAETSIVNGKRVRIMERVVPS